jgi:hypothetical protein
MSLSSGAQNTYQKLFLQNILLGSFASVPMLLACLYVLFILPHRHDKRDVRGRKQKEEVSKLRNKQNHCQSKI